MLAWGAMVTFFQKLCRRTRQRQGEKDWYLWSQFWSWSFPQWRNRCEGDSGCRLRGQRQRVTKHCDILFVILLSGGWMYFYKIIPYLCTTLSKHLLIIAPIVFHERSLARKFAKNPEIVFVGVSYFKYSSYLCISTLKANINNNRKNENLNLN